MPESLDIVRLKPLLAPAMAAEIRDWQFQPPPAEPFAGMAFSIRRGIWAPEPLSAAHAWTHQAAPDSDWTRVTVGPQEFSLDLWSLVVRVPRHLTSTQVARLVAEQELLDDDPSNASFALQEEYMAWRREPRVDPAAGPDAHPLEATLAQRLQFAAWQIMIGAAEHMPCGGYSFGC
jgi:hypothetical protein